jgi:hypothetical protein
MLAIPIALLTPPNRCAFARSLREVSPRPTQFLSCQYHYPINPLDATLMDLPASVVNKRLTSKLTPLNATLTKNWGAHLSTFTPSDVPTNLRTAPFSFPTLTNATSRKPFPFTPLQMPGGIPPQFPFWFTPDAAKGREPVRIACGVRATRGAQREALTSSFWRAAGRRATGRRWKWRGRRGE